MQENVTRRIGLLLVLLCSGCFPIMCGRTVPVGRFGSYRPPHLRARLPGGDTLTVYRVRLWTFQDDSPPSLQVEYESPIPVGDTMAVARINRRLLPVVVPYAEELGIPGIILTATNFRYEKRRFAPKWRLDHYSAVAHRPHAGLWMLGADSITMRAVEVKHGSGIFRQDGQPLDVAGLEP